MPHHARSWKNMLDPSLREDEALNLILQFLISVMFLVALGSTIPHQSSYYWLQFLIPLLMVILFAVDTGLFISTQQQFTVLLKIQRTRKSNKLMGPHPMPDPKND